MAAKKPDWPSWSRYVGIGLEFAAAIGGFAFFGYLLGRALGHSRAGIVVGAVLGLIGGTYNLIRESLAAFQPPKRDGGKGD